MYTFRTVCLRGTFPGEPFDFSLYVTHPGPSGVIETRLSTEQKIRGSSPRWGVYVFMYTVAVDWPNLVATDRQTVGDLVLFPFMYGDWVLCFVGLLSVDLRMWNENETHPSPAAASSLYPLRIYSLGVTFLGAHRTVLWEDHAVRFPGRHR
jgi:hypothetical protein